MKGLQGQTDKHTDGQKDRRTDRQTEKKGNRKKKKRKPKDDETDRKCVFERETTEKQLKIIT